VVSPVFALKTLTTLPENTEEVGAKVEEVEEEVEEEEVEEEEEEEEVE